MKRMIHILLALSVLSHAYARTPSPEGAAVYFISPANNETVTGPVTVRFGLRNMGVAPAGIQADSTGHHHLLIDTGLPEPDKPIPSDEHHHHFGKGQTETTIELSPGTHTLQLLLGDFSHIPHDPPVLSEQIIILVK